VTPALENTINPDQMKMIMTAQKIPSGILRFAWGKLGDLFKEY